MTYKIFMVLRKWMQEFLNGELHLLINGTLIYSKGKPMVSQYKYIPNPTFYFKKIQCYTSFFVKINNWRLL